MDLKSAVEVALEKLEAREPIPRMTHPLSVHWDQPNRREITVDATHAMMSRATLDKLHDYSCSIPSGVYEGKMWKRASEYMRNPPDFEPEFWLLCWYGPSKDPDQCSVNTRRIIIV